MQRRIVLAVTSDVSIGLMTGFPEYLAANGWDVHVVSSSGPRSQALAASPGVSVHHLEMRRDPAPLDDLKALVRWVRLLRSIRPDVVSVGTPKAGLLGGIAGVLARVPSRVYMLRGLRYETTEGLKRSVFVALEKVSVACAHRVVAVSSSLRDVAIADRLGRASKFHVVGSGSSNGVDVDRFATTPGERNAAKATRWPGRPDVPVVGFIGRVHPDKGLDLLADAVEILAQREIPGRLLVVGGSDDPAGEALVQRLQRTGWEVEIVGAVSDVAPLLKVMDLLCLPTKREGFPNVVLEAAAAGIPTVATMATGVPDAIVDNSTGSICRNRDPRRLATLLIDMLSNPQLRHERGEAALNRVRDEFSRESVWQKSDHLYGARGYEA